MPSADIVDDIDRPVKILNADVWTAQMVRLGYTTVKDQARAAGCSRSYLHEMLAGDVEPHTRIARRMVAVSKIPPQRLFKLADA